MAKFNFKDPLTVGLSATGVAVSSANFLNNSKKRKSDLEFQKTQLGAIKDLTKSLNRFNENSEKLPAERVIIREVPKKKRSRIRFFQKSNSSTVDYALSGATIGGAIGGGGALFLPKKLGISSRWTKKTGKDGKQFDYEEQVNDPDFKYPKLRDKYNSLEPYLRDSLLTLGGAAIGATLGAIAGLIKDVSQAINRKTTVNARLMKDVLDNLHKSGFKEGRDFTRDPRMSTLLKTKVCLVISRSSDSLQLLINTVNDGKLRSISSGITKNLPGMSTVTEKVTDRFNELNITTMTTNNGDSVWVASVAERFIKSGYPVYLVEVG